MRKGFFIALGFITLLSFAACNNTASTTNTTSKSSSSSAVPNSSVAEVKDDYVAIGGLTPYEKVKDKEEPVSVAQVQPNPQQNKQPSNNQQNVQPQQPVQQQESPLGTRKIRLIDVSTGEVTIQEVPIITEEQAYQNALDWLYNDYALNHTEAEVAEQKKKIDLTHNRY